MNRFFNTLETVRVLGHRGTARRRFTAFRDREALGHWQRGQLTAHLRWTARHSYFYRDWFDRSGTDPADLTAWPQMDKAQVQANLLVLLTRPVNLQAARALTSGAMASRDFAAQLPGGITVGLSSGTTGPAALFLVSTGERLSWAGMALARVLRGKLRDHPPRIAFFLRANSPLYETMDHRRAVRFVYFDLLTPLPETFPILEEMEPTVIVAPPGVLRMLAAARSAGRLRVSPRQIVSVAETLDPDDRTAVETAFRVRLDEVYQATEGFLAATCPAGALHWNEDVLHIERAGIEGDARGRYHPVITDFRRRLQPFIRYRLGDVVVDEPEDTPRCPCGSSFRRIRRIEGRQDDVLRLPGRHGDGEGWLFPDFVRLAVTHAAPDGLEDFRVRQITPQLLYVHLRPDPTSAQARSDFRDRFAAALDLVCARAGMETPTCQLAAWTDLEQGNGLQKRRRVVGLTLGQEESLAASISR